MYGMMIKEMNGQDKSEKRGSKLGTAARIGGAILVGATAAGALKDRFGGVSTAEAEGAKEVGFGELMSVNPTSGNWNHTDKFRFVNVSGEVEDVSFALDYWDPNVPDERVNVTLAPGEPTEQGLGQFCDKKWQVDANVTTREADARHAYQGFIVEVKEDGSCVVTPTSAPTEEPTKKPTKTPKPEVTSTFTAEPTEWSTATPPPPTELPTETPTNTPVPSPTPTGTYVLPTPSNTPVDTETPVPSDTPTAVNTQPATSTAEPTSTPVTPVATPENPADLALSAGGDEFGTPAKSVDWGKVASGAAAATAGLSVAVLADEKKRKGIGSFVKRIFGKKQV